MKNEDAIARPGNWVRSLFKVNENTTVRPRTWVRRFVKIVARVSVTLMALFIVAHFGWRFSGSNKWEFVEERNGVKVYTLKSPGSDLLQVKGIVRVRSTLRGLMSFLMDPKTTTDYGYTEQRTIERVDDWLQYASFRLDLPFPFPTRTREFVTRSQIHQDLRTKEVLMIAAAAPEKAPPNDCCFRVTEMNNTWRFTPLENGQIEIEYVNNTNMGGFIPNLLINTWKPKFMVEVLSKLQDLLDKKKSQDAKLDFIKE